MFPITPTDGSDKVPGSKAKSKPKIWIYHRPVDMRKSIDALCILVASEMRMNPQNGDVFVFYSYSADRVKLLHWDKSGFVVIYKRLEKDKFFVPQNFKRTISVTSTQLRWLLNGINYNQGNSDGELEFNTYF